MADMFIKIADVAGESTDSTHAGEIEVLSFSFGMSNSTSIGSATTGGGGAGRVSFAEFNFMKKLDKASPMIMKNCAIGDHFTEIDFTSRKPGGTQLEYYKIKFLECYITSYQISASDGGGDPMESVSFAYAKINTTYTEQLATGGSGSPVPWGWDLTTNKPQ